MDASQSGERIGFILFVRRIRNINKDKGNKYDCLGMKDQLSRRDSNGPPVREATRGDTIKWENNNMCSATCKEREYSSLPMQDKVSYIL